jgi:hypothetical protein
VPQLLGADNLEENVEKTGITMTNRTVTGSIETDITSEQIMRVLLDPRLIPLWAPNFADEVNPADTQWQVRKGEQRFLMTLESDVSLMIVNYLRETSPGIRGGAYMRLLPRPGGGSVIVMTLPVPMNRSQSEVVGILEEELSELIRMSTRQY